MNKENTLTRDELQSKYIEWFIYSSTLEQLIDAVRSDMSRDLGDLSDVELVKEIKDYAPHLIPDNITLSVQ